MFLKYENCMIFRQRILFLRYMTAGGSKTPYFPTFVEYTDHNFSSVGSINLVNIFILRNIYLYTLKFCILIMNLMFSEDMSTIRFNIIIAIL